MKVICPSEVVSRNPGGELEASILNKASVVLLIIPYWLRKIIGLTGWKEWKPAADGCLNFNFACCDWRAEWSTDCLIWR